MEKAPVQKTTLWTKYENTKAFQTLMFGGKVGGAFGGISTGLIVLFGLISRAMAFAGQPSAGYVLPILLGVLCVLGFYFHIRWSPILSAPFIMFGFVFGAATTLGVALYLSFGASLELAIADSAVIDPVLQLHGTHFKKLNTDEEVKAHIEKNKTRIRKNAAHKQSVSDAYGGSFILLTFTAVYGFFSRLWHMENAIIDTQQRLISLVDRSLTIAQNANAGMQTVSITATDQKERFSDIAMATVQSEKEIEALKAELADLPAVGFRKGRMLFFKPKKSG